MQLIGAGVSAGSVIRSSLSPALCQTKRVTTGSIAGASSASVTITWDTAFADANYTVTVGVLEADATTTTLRVHHIVSQSPTAVVVLVANDNAVTAKTGTLHAIAIHD